MDGEELWTALLQRLPDHGLRLFGMTGLSGSLAEYNSGNGSILYLTDSPVHERAMAVMHELGHMIKHPPGSGHQPVSHSVIDEGEERLVHAAAALACAELGLDDYEATMKQAGVPDHLLVAPTDPREAVAMSHLLVALVRGQLSEVIASLGGQP